MSTISGFSAGAGFQIPFAANRSSDRSASVNQANQANRADESRQAERTQDEVRTRRAREEQETERAESEQGESTRTSDRLEESRRSSGAASVQGLRRTDDGPDDSDETNSADGTNDPSRPPQRTSGKLLDVVV